MFLPFPFLSSFQININSKYVYDIYHQLVQSFSNRFPCYIIQYSSLPYFITSFWLSNLTILDKQKHIKPFIPFPSYTCILLSIILLILPTFPRYHPFLPNNDKSKNISPTSYLTEPSRTTHPFTNCFLTLPCWILPPYSAHPLEQHLSH